VGIRGDRRDEALVDQAPRGRPGILAVLAGQRLGVDLRQGYGLELAAQPFRPVEGGVGAALGMGDEHAEAALAKLSRGGVKVGAKALEGSLHQEPAAPRRPLSEQLQLVFRTVRHCATRELQAVEEVGGPVVDSGEEMEVKVC
jgi:hypothetical protein